MKQQDQYYNKFLTAGNTSQNKQKSLSSSKEKVDINKQVKPQFKPALAALEDSQLVMIQYSDKERNDIPIPIQEEINEITYELFVGQTKEPLYQTFFKNQQDLLGHISPKQPRQPSPKENKLRSQRKEENKSSKRKEQEITTQRKKKEFYEEIIKANRDCIRFNPFSVNKEDERKFEEEQFNTDKVVEIQLENEVQIRRDLTEKKHKKILMEKIPEIFNRIGIAGEKKYFIKNKYNDLINFNQ